MVTRGPRQRDAAGRERMGWLSSFLTLAVFAAAIAVMTGWLANQPVLRGLGSASDSMAFNSAALFLLLSISLWLKRGRIPLSAPRSRIAFLLAACVLIIAGLSLAEYVFDVDLGIDQVFVRDASSAAGVVYPGRMAPSCAVSFIFCALSVILIDAGAWKAAALPHLFTALVCALAALSLFSRLYGVAPLYSWTTYFASMPLATAATFIILSCASLFARPGKGVTRLFLSESIGGFIMRYFVFIILPTFFVIHKIVYRLQHFGSYDIRTAAALDAFLKTALFIVFYLYIAWRFERKGLEARGIEHAAKMSETRLRDLIEELPVPYYTLDKDGTVVFVDRLCLEKTGYAKEEMFGKPFSGFIHPDDLNKFRECQTRLREDGLIDGCTFSIVKKDGALLMVSTTARATYDVRGDVRETHHVFTDVTHEKQQEEAVRAREELYHSLVDASPDAIALVGSDMKIIAVNVEMVRLHGFATPGDMVGTDVTLLVHPDDLSKVWKVIEMSAGSSKTGVVECRMVRKDGSMFMGELSFGIVRDSFGKVKSFIGMGRDITARVEMEREFRAQIERIGICEETAGFGVWDWDIVKDSVSWSPGYRRLFGHAEDERPSLQGILSRIEPHERDQVEQAVKGAILNRSGFDIEFGMQHPAKGHRVIGVRGKVVFDEGENPVRFTAICIDITEPKAYERKIADARDYFDAIINSVADPIFVKDRQHRWVLLNDAYCSFMGYARAELLGKTDHDYFPRDESDVFWQKDEEVFISGGENINEEYFTDASGVKRTIITKKTLYVDKEGHQLIVGVIRDVTELRRKEEALQVSETHFRGLFDNMSSGAVIYEAVAGGSDFVITDINRSVERIERVKREDVIGKRITEVFSGVTDTGLLTVFQEVHRTGTGRFYPSTIYAGGRIAGWRESFVFKLPTGEVASVFDDVTSRKIAEVRLSKFNECLLSFTGDPDENIRKLARICGELMNADCVLYNSFNAGLLVTKAGWQIPDAYKMEDRADGHLCYDVINCGEPSVLFVEDLLQTPYVKSDPNVMKFGLKTYIGAPVRVADKNVGSVCAVYTKKTGMSQDDRHFINIIASAIGTEERRKETMLELGRAYEELEGAQAQLIQSAKMAALGQLASSIAHEIANPLTGILNTVQIIKLKGGQERGVERRELAELVDLIGQSGMRCKQITESLLSFSRSSKRQYVRISIEDIVRKVLLIVKYEMRMLNIAVVEDLTSETPVVNADAQLMQQALFDLIMNAQWAIHQKAASEGTITIASSFDRERRMACLRVSDDGIGISEEERGKVFDAFFTTKPAGEGTGLGLSIAKKIVEDHKGTITVESVVGKGSTFTIMLPVAE